MAHSIYICVLGGEDAAIAKAIYEKNSAGSDYNGNTFFDYTDPVGSVTDDRMRPIVGSLSNSPGTGLTSTSGAGVSGAFSLGPATSGMTSSGGTNGAWALFNSALLSPNHNGTETAGLHVLMTPAVFLGV